MAAAGIPRLVRAPEYRAVIAIDLGTYASSFAVVFRTPEATGDPSKSDVNMCTPGDASSAAVAKTLTAILLDANTEAVIAIGAPARKKFATLCDDDAAGGVLYFEGFKMNMAPSKRGDVSPFDVQVMAMGAKVRKPLMLPAVREDAERRMAAMSPGGDLLRPDQVGWVITVPAIWDDAAKGFMREAARVAGINTDALVLALEPEAAAIASVLDAAPAVRDQFVVGERVMILDCGGGTVDITMSEVTSNRPLQLREFMPASGGAWGGTYVDAGFMRYVGDVVNPDFSLVDHGSRVAMLDAWEGVKRTFDASGETTEYRLDFTPVERCLPDASGLADAVERVNTARGWTGTDAVTRTRRGQLVLSPASVQSFFAPLVDATIHHVSGLLDTAAGMGKPVKFILLVGGFAESRFLQQRVRNAFGSRAQVVMPSRPQQMVNKGAAQFGLYGDTFITSRKARCTYCVRIAEPWDDARHRGYEALKFRPDGDTIDYCAAVLDPLVKKGDDISVDAPVTRGDLAPFDKSHLTVSVRLYCIDESDRADGRAHVVQRADVAHIPDAVPETAQMCNIEVRVADSEATPMDDRIVDLNLFFGRTEITAQASARVSGDSKTSTISYASAAAPAASAASS